MTSAGKGGGGGCSIVIWVGGALVFAAPSSASTRRSSNKMDSPRFTFRVRIIPRMFWAIGTSAIDSDGTQKRRSVMCAREIRMPSGRSMAASQCHTRPLVPFPSSLDAKCPFRMARNASANRTANTPHTPIRYCRCHETRGPQLRSASPSQSELLRAFHVAVQGQLPQLGPQPAFLLQITRPGPLQGMH